MANSGRQHFTSVYKRRRQVVTGYGPDSRHVFVFDKPICGQCKRRWHQTKRFSLIILLLSVGLITAPLLAAASASSIDYGSLTWSKWSRIYTPIATDPTALGRIYSTGPRVRAKILVSTHISTNELQAGEAIFRQQIREIVAVESIDRVQIEYLQTDACSETEQGVYYVSLGISAVPPPGTIVNSSDSTVLMLSAIETERKRILENLKHGKMLATGKLTIDSLMLFGVSMSLVDIVLDGEDFAQIYLKPWLGLQLAIATADSTTMDVSSWNSEHYTTGRDAFQDLRLRLLLAQQLGSLQVRTSDVIVHSPTSLLPFSTYGADVGVLEIEIHVPDIRYAAFVEMKLLGASNASSEMFNSVVAGTFHEMEPQWQLIAMDVDTAAGELFSSASQSSAAPSSGTTNGGTDLVSELTFEVYNISLAQLERTKWFVLDFIRVALAHVVPCRVWFGRIGFPSSSFALSSLTIHNDGDGVVTEDGFTAASIFDPINAINWTLSFKVEPDTTTAFDSAMLEDHVTTMQRTVEMGLQQALGVNDPTNTASTTFRGASNWVDPELTNAAALGPFVSFTLTIRVKPLDASGTILESPNFFQLHHVRSALVLLLQQVAISNDQVSIVSAKALDRATGRSDKLGHSWHRLLLFKYRARISDESQRRGIRSVIFSYRLASTISMYSGRTVKLIERQIDLHADGSPGWPRHLPGVLSTPTKADNISDGFVTSPASLLGQQETFVYDFNDPEPRATSGVVVDAADVCYSGGTGSSSSSGLCFRLRFTGTTQVAPMFLRTLQSLHPVASSTISLPLVHAALDTADASSSHPAPWVLVGGQNDGDDTLWTFLVERSPSTFKRQSARLTFAAVATMQDLSATTPFTLDLEIDPEDLATAPVVRRRPFGDLAVVATGDQPAPAFLSAGLPEVANNGRETTSVTVTLNLQEPRLGGLYSATLLSEKAPACSACTQLLADCNGRLECRAFSACTSVLLDADLTLISTMLQNDGLAVNVDASWLLEDCLSPSDGTVWSSSIPDSLTCLWQNRCPLAYNETLGKQIVLVHGHGEQVLTFQLAAGFASLSFTLDSSEGESTLEFMEDFATNATDVTAQLDAMLTGMYRAALSNAATVESTLATTEDAGTGGVTAHLTIHYLLLGRLPLPLVEITQSGSSDAAFVDVTAPKETLHLRVVPIT
ncbi:hypothetical protein PHYPSEUDO_010794 [Phytophthora pseudosyringae]|uniref:Uncharacterized protein n=1 Tax=Phytophthora pseudosyringae TaxID=221518 RepID=A0A8T1W7G1_9STRA|nr:hypothetical protein PHYPSEUDO_010794 [Phytophthora pseudosyringae]